MPQEEFDYYAETAAEQDNEADTDHGVKFYNPAD